MSKELRIDYHFHPNLFRSDSLSRKKCEEIWGRCKEKKIDCVIVTEHSYKNPKRAYEFMKKMKPEGMFCFPGMECVTKEGVDLIVFSDSEGIYELDELKPFKLSYLKLVEFVCSRADLYSYVTHPYTLGLTSVVRKLGMDVYRESLDLLGAVEISNGAFENVKQIMEKGVFKKILRSKLIDVEKTRALPKEDYPKDVKFLAAGSDAHHVEDIGNCYVVKMDEGWENESDVFRAVTRNGGGGEVFIDNRSFSVKILAKTAVTTAYEFLIKRFYGKR